MAHVPKTMAASAPALSLPLEPAEKRRRKGTGPRWLKAAQKPPLRNWSGGTSSAFSRWSAAYLRRQEDVEDVAQQVFLKVYLSLKKFDQRAALFDLVV